MALKVKKGDMIEVIEGKEKGKKGKVLRIVNRKDKKFVLVEKLNIIKKHMRPSPRLREGGIIEMEGPIHISNVAVICPKCNARTRIGFKVTEEKKFRYCKKCGEVID